jgi:hypothetical protein
MFLDSHVEVLNGWLFYLLEEIQKDRLVTFFFVKKTVQYHLYEQYFSVPSASRNEV